MLLNLGIRPIIGQSHQTTPRRRSTFNDAVGQTGRLVKLRQEPLTKNRDGIAPRENHRATPQTGSRNLGTFHSRNPARDVHNRIDFRQFAFMVGPRVRVLSTDTLNFSVRAVAGVSNGNAKAVLGLFALDANNTVLAASMGASLTLKLGQGFGFRIAQPEVYITQFGDATQTSFRVSTGFVFVYGR